MAEPICSVAGCERPRRARGWCMGHYDQHRKGRPLGPLKAYRPGGIPSAKVRDEQGRKRCTKCDAWRPEAEFYSAPREPDGLTYRCKQCYSADAERQRLSRYSLTQSAYEALLMAQGGVCAICERPCPRGSLSVDHDHKCCSGATSCGECVRGLLCRTCNQALGNMRDDPELLVRAARYLTRAQSANQAATGHQKG